MSQIVAEDGSYTEYWITRQKEDLAYWIKSVNHWVSCNEFDNAAVSANNILHAIQELKRIHAVNAEVISRQA